MAALRAEASATVLAEMGPRYGLVVDKAMGVAMKRMQTIAKPLRPDHALAQALWETGWYEARMVACMADDPRQVTPEQMDRWRVDFDNWGIVDTVCFKLFDQVSGAAVMIPRWCGLNDEFGRRAGFALMACMALHGTGEEADLLAGLKLIEACATDERNFVKKSVNWALRAIGGTETPTLRAEARAVAGRLAASSDKTARWNGKDALRAFAKADKGKDQ
ncbi:MAG: DNA alkylation repair protein [Alphaproteobacteria bacterium]|nr:DNA alkylation repair protein [Alphaproteobacteria bacterium]MBU1513474.1 DNA alkylation repair protein [Alphaproteobacteria bacterium]MBU2096466.1 DNA alkylation repair protein [Alphaproteobacteria bacterium]MBU2149842.1 DNA alkylation repair protein [Alphaproteobacteria bacterium]MBU2308252.1 DNA alkylation repair protein [Alphaproteobacteria bacterium]